MPLNISGSVVDSTLVKSIQTTHIINRGLKLHLDASSTGSYVGSGTGWYDLTGNLYNGTLTNGPTYSSVNSGCIVFDGTNDYVTTGDVDFGSTAEFTLETWVYFTAFNSNNCIMKKNTENDYWPAISMYVDNTGKFVGYYSSQSYGSCLEGALSSTGVVTTGVWNHLIFSKGSGGYTQMKLYKNGVSQSYTNYLYGSHINEVCNSSRPLIIGIDFDTPNYIVPLNGKIAVVRAYNRQLSEDEVLINYNIQKSRFGL
jgi:hypothetical protein